MADIVSEVVTKTWVDQATDAWVGGVAPGVTPGQTDTAQIVTGADITLDSSIPVGTAILSALTGAGKLSVKTTGGPYVLTVAAASVAYLYHSAGTFTFAGNYAQGTAWTAAGYGIRTAGTSAILNVTGNVTSAAAGYGVWAGGTTPTIVIGGALGASFNDAKCIPLYVNAAATISVGGAGVTHAISAASANLIKVVTAGSTITWAGTFSSSAVGASCVYATAGASFVGDFNYTTSGDGTGYGLYLAANADFPLTGNLVNSGKGVATLVRDGAKLAISGDATAADGCTGDLLVVYNGSATPTAATIVVAGDLINAAGAASAESTGRAGYLYAFGAGNLVVGSLTVNGNLSITNGGRGIYVGLTGFTGTATAVVKGTANLEKQETVGSWYRSVLSVTGAGCTGEIWGKVTITGVIGPAPEVANNFIVASEGGEVTLGKQTAPITVKCDVSRSDVLLVWMAGTITVWGNVDATTDTDVGVCVRRQSAGGDADPFPALPGLITVNGNIGLTGTGWAAVCEGSDDGAGLPATDDQIVVTGSITVNGGGGAVAEEHGIVTVGGVIYNHGTGIAARCFVNTGFSAPMIDYTRGGTIHANGGIVSDGGGTAASAEGAGSLIDIDGPLVVTGGDAIVMTAGAQISGTGTIRSTGHVHISGGTWSHTARLPVPSGSSITGGTFASGSTLVILGDMTIDETGAALAFADGIIGHHGDLALTNTGTNGVIITGILTVKKMRREGALTVTGDWTGYVADTSRQLGNRVIQRFRKFAHGRSN
jgi:hypothetical protein